MQAFGLPGNAPFVEPALVRWKYDEPRPDWEGPRSYAWISAAEGGEIAAHACLWPVTYRLPGADSAEISAGYFLDWAAGRKIPGAGVLLVRKLASLVQVLVAIGGSADTQQILPKCGFRVAGEFAFFVRVLRPWRQFRTDPYPRGWKAPLRLARNFVWSRVPMPQAPAGWRCAPLAGFDSTHEAMLAAPAPFPHTRRSAALMNYWLWCPGAKIAAFLLSDRSGPRGWFLLARVEGVLRIADLRIDSADPKDWQAAYAVATRTAFADPWGCELIAAAATPLVRDAIRCNGFRLHHTEPVFLLDPKALLANHGLLEITLMESDAAWLYAPEYPYMS